MTTHGIRKAHVRLLAIAAALFALLSLTSPLHAQTTIVIDTIAGTIGGQGKGGTFRGTTIVRALVDSTGVATFYLKGDLTLLSTDTLIAAGPHPILLVVSDNVVIPNGATFDFSAVGTMPGPGGGAPGAGGAGAATGGTSGAGGNGGCFVSGCIGCDLPGVPGCKGAAGSAGQPGLAGLVGGSGFGNPTGGGAAGAAGESGSGGKGGTAGPGGKAGVSNLCGVGAPGGSGGDGGTGATGGTGHNGGNGGGGLNDLMGWMLSAGSAGGGGGGAGSGGGAGGGGGGGQGGEGGNSDCCIGGCGGAGEGAGGLGGSGGQGGTGGTGGAGGGGGIGGAGGGAFAIKALGRLTVAGSLFAQGGDAVLGSDGDTGPSGTSGTTGCPGHGYPCGGYYGGPGGCGGDGGCGGKGGKGGNGGKGGGGAGGTIELFASVVEGFMSTIDATGGSGGKPGAEGRFLLGQNTDEPFAGMTLGTKTEKSHGWENANLCLSGEPASPNIPDLVGGAESYGPTTLSAATDFALVQSQAPSGCPAALVRMAVGPTPYDADLTGYDYLFFLNLSGQTLASPHLGVGSDDFFNPLYQGGQDNNPLFGGHGSLPLTQLAADEIYATLVPSGLAPFNFGAMVGTTPYVLNDAPTSHFVKVGNMQVLYLVPDHPAVNVTSQVSVTQGAITKNGTNRYEQSVTIQNIGKKAITGPQALVLDDLTSKVTLTNATGVTMTTPAPAGSPYLDTTSMALKPGESVTLTLEFTAKNSAISYTVGVLNGPGSR